MAKYSHSWLEEINCTIEIKIDDSITDYDDISDLLEEAKQNPKTEIKKKCVDVWGGDIINVATGKKLECE